jgi:hypothetical protein
MPLDRKWLKNHENEIIIKRNRDHKKKNSPKKMTKKKNPPSSPAQSSSLWTNSHTSVTTNQSSNTVVTSMTAKEGKRTQFLISQMSNDSNRKYATGAPVGHISRQLNADHAMNVNIDHSTITQIFQFAVDESKLLTFKKKHNKNDLLPPIVATSQQQEDNWDRRMYPPCGIFDDMTPREGGYYPEHVVSKRKEVRFKPIVQKGFSIREDVNNSVEGYSSNEEDNSDNFSAQSDIIADDQTYHMLVKKLSKKGQDISLNELSQISKIRSPHDYINIIFRYIHILILGFDQKRSSSKRDIVNGSGGEPDAKQTLLKECSPLLLYMQHVRRSA